MERQSGGGQIEVSNFTTLVVGNMMENNNEKNNVLFCHRGQTSNKKGTGLPARKN